MAAAEAAAEGAADVCSGEAAADGGAVVIGVTTTSMVGAAGSWGAS